MFQYADYIYAVYKNKSFSKAAEALFISQPSLSMTVKKAEKQLGLPVFDRSSSPVSLTSFGVEYIRAVEQLRDIEHGLMEFVRQDKAQKIGHLSLGCSNLSADYFLTRSLVDFHFKFPGIDLEVHNLNTLQNKHLLDSAELDFIITNRPLDDRKYMRESCAGECLVVAVPKLFAVNSLIRQKALSLDELGDDIFALDPARCVPPSVFARTPFILLTKENYLRSCTDILFKEAGINPPTVLEMEHSAEAYNFTRLGLGATVVSNRIVTGNISDDLYYYKINSSYTYRETWLSWRRGAYFTSAMKCFKGMLLGKSK